MHNDDRMACSDKTARSSSFLACFLGLLTYSFCQPWTGSPPHPVTLGEWYELLCVGRTVKWYERRQLFEPHPKKCQTSSAHLPGSHISLGLCGCRHFCCNTAPVRFPEELRPWRTHPRVRACHYTVAVQDWTLWQVVVTLLESVKEL